MNKDVKLFALSTCIHCKNAKKLLDEKRIDYKCNYVDLLPGKEKESCINELKKYNPQLSFPTIVIGNKVIVGYDEEAILEALKK